MPPAHLIPSLEPKLRDLYARHKELAKAIDWAYHEYLPLDVLRADPQSLPKLSAVSYLAVETALFTEVNLPWFTTGLYNVFRGAVSPMREFIYDWTAEEDQHAMLLETYLLLGDNGDHRERARLRKIIVKQGWEPNIDDHFQAIAYTATQELATRAFYQRVALVCRDEDPLLARALIRLAKDETLHYAFYKDAVKAHLEVEPNYAEPLARILMDFAMPGAEMPDYATRAAVLAREGVYGPDHYYDMVVDHLWKEWDIPGLLPSAEPARAAQKTLIAHHRKLGRVASMYALRRKKEKADGAASAAAGSNGATHTGGGANGSANGQASNGHAAEPARTDGVYGEVLKTAPKS
ncbi:MAG: Probable acyl-[acyl-carrier protein] desaturase DESA1 (Acyl-[ACP] desaturase) (Stearoyl-ACP desaturase) (Protein DES) [uncultured Chloroflexi bacterium]|uniref:Probable acyl-[acyl-carrier protein] desaturase DESA1 (Acyl-[ACP] desaturase) (Stearoyl-ACP desaturase) (Protein DES) n=1 Tax=uncultured Chloroflexota bacterium TaxID=166587 RepID=A0A6J4IAI3_9CHLR|nr:MAG: Probable acyl-[acyl-carrier protein] desaturase DESA1 (Acyl-[ACP] desaturase) (Stearoyl-ACP desaturase) (Protein DES) [uncultured Chloroflexota bacterium]